jgi:DNA ligase 1
MSASWIHKANESNSKLHKEDVVKQALAAAVLGSTNAQMFLGLAKACYNPYVTFGVRQIPHSPGGITVAENPWNEFNTLLEDLATRKYSGHAARDQIVVMCKRFTTDEWDTFCAPVLRRDLRAGFSETTINKVCKKTVYQIPKFTCQLATNSEGRPEMKGKKRLEPKLDGVRMLLVCNSAGVTTAFSRNGKVYENFGHIEDQVAAHSGFFLTMTELKAGFVLDGEVTSDSFQELMKQARRKTKANALDAVFNVFDIIPLMEFEEGRWNAKLTKRLDLLEKLRFVIDKLANVEYLTHLDVDLDTAAGRNQMDRYAQDMIKAKFEGIMIKDYDAPYECKRAMSWMKWKPTKTFDLVVVDIEEGTGRNAGRTGALVCEGTDDGKFIRVNCGSGMSDEQRDDYWINRKKVKGQIAEVMADAVTKAEDGSYSLRFPRLVRFRDDK